MLYRRKEEKMSSEWWKDETVALVSVEEKELQESDENKISYKMILIWRLENYTTKYNTDEIKQNRGKKIVKCVINPVLELKSVVHVYFCLYLLVSIVWPMKIPWNECNNENPHTRNSRKITKFEKFIHSPFVLDFFWLFEGRKFVVENRISLVKLREIETNKQTGKKT